MKTIVMLVYPEVAVGQLIGMAEVFRFANQLAAYLQPDSPALYQVLFYQLDGNTSYQSSELSVHCVSNLPAQLDAVLLPGNYIHHRSGLAELAQLFQQHSDWFAQIQAQGCWLGAACNGTFALASTGLLDGAKATTCWFLADHFRHQFPQVQLDVNATVCRSGQNLTAGATSAYLQLCLQLIREFHGVRFSHQLSKVLLVEPALHGQAPFLSVQQLISHQDERIVAVQQYLQQHLAEPVELQQLAQQFAMSGRTLIRRFKAATGDTPMAWLQKLRIDKAKVLLESTQLPLEQLTNQVGYEDVSSFRKLFQQYTRMTPKAYRAQFSQQ